MSTDSAHGGTSMKTVCGKAIRGGETPPLHFSICLGKHVGPTKIKNCPPFSFYFICGPFFMTLYLF